MAEHTPASLDKLVQEATERAVRELTNRVLSRARTNLSGAVVQPRTRQLLNSLESRVETRDKITSGSVFTKVPHGRYLEQGTAPHLIVGHPVLRFVVSGRIVWARQVHHPGNIAYHWLQKAHDETKSEVNPVVTKAWSDLLGTKT